MTHNTDSHYRRSIRLKDYDYSQAGGYFVTICTKNRQYLFGEIIDGQMVLNEAGRMVSEAWEWLEKQYNYVELDEWVIMPNHMHGIIIINDHRGPFVTTLLTQDHMAKLFGKIKKTIFEHIRNIFSECGLVGRNHEWTRIKTNWKKPPKIRKTQKNAA